MSTDEKLIIKVESMGNVRFNKRTALNNMILNQKRLETAEVRLLYKLSLLNSTDKTTKIKYSCTVSKQVLVS